MSNWPAVWFRALASATRWVPVVSQVGLAALATLARVTPAHAQVTSRNVTLLSHVNEYPSAPFGLRFAYSACWSYIHPDGREYAVLGVASGTAIYNVSDPVFPHRVAFIP